jgi:hypothetical protein
MERPGVQPMANRVAASALGVEKIANAAIAKNTDNSFFMVRYLVSLMKTETSMSLDSKIMKIL